jgi:hypothetical protein
MRFLPKLGPPISMPLPKQNDTLPYETAGKIEFPAAGLPANRTRGAPPLEPGTVQASSRSQAVTTAPGMRDQR